MERKAESWDLTGLTLSEAASLIEASIISPITLTQAHLDRIDRLDSTLHCFITCTRELALEAAQMAEMDVRLHRHRGPLQGIPLAVKDVFELRGSPTTAGSRILAASVSQRDSAVVQRLKEAGAVILGKLNMSEWAMKASGANPTFGDCCNPWNQEYAPGGSSSGSAAAVAAGMCFGALGSDTGGSVRIPASLCGIVGLKPSYGRISTCGMIPLSWSLDHVGLLARRVRDVALLLQVLAGYDQEDLSSLNVPVDEYVAHLDDGIRGWRIAVADHPFLRAGEQADEEVLQAFHEAIHVFERLGAHLEEGEPPQGALLREANSLMLLSEAASYHQERLQATPQAFHREVLESLRQGLTYTATDYIHAREMQRQGRRQFEHVFEAYDLVLCPATPTAAPRLGNEGSGSSGPSLTSFTSAWNVLGLPALALPCGFTREQLPVGLQIIGPWWEEARVLCAGSAFEQITSWHERKPPIA